MFVLSIDISYLSKS